MRPDGTLVEPGTDGTLKYNSVGGLHVATESDLNTESTNRAFDSPGGGDRSGDPVSAQGARIVPYRVDRNGPVLCSYRRRAAPRRGGNWTITSYAGVFALSLNLCPFEHGRATGSAPLISCNLRFCRLKSAWAAQAARWMVLHLDQLLISKRIYDMMLYAYPALAQFPKSEKHTLAAEIKRTMFEMQRLTIRANKERRKMDWLRQLDASLELLRTQVRLSHELGFLPTEEV